MDILTNITKNIGDIIAKVKNNNTLIDELNTKYNPTFVEIVDELKEENNTILLALLYDWYKKRNQLEFSAVQKKIDSMKEINSPEYKKKTSRTYIGGCGISDDYSGSCGSSSNYSRTHNIYCGCGSSGGC